jgi:RNA polymerase sigma factor (sigma-70 family)
MFIVVTAQSVELVRANRIDAAAVLTRSSHVREIDRVEKQSMPTQSLHAYAPSVVASRRVDQSLVAAFRRREASGVRAMYSQYGRLVYAVAHRVLGQHHLAEEAAQQTFVRAWQAADRIDVERDPAGWLATIAKRVAIDVYRREARRPTSALNDVAADDPALVSLPPDLDALDAVWHVRHAIDALPRDEATVVRLQHLDGLTQSEISEKLGIALGTVKSRSHRAHQKLAALLGHLREVPHD